MTLEELKEDRAGSPPRRRPRPKAILRAKPTQRSKLPLRFSSGSPRACITPFKREVREGGRFTIELRFRLGDVARAFLPLSEHASRCRAGSC